MQQLPLFNADSIVSIARECLGVKWVHQGRSEIYGIDCIGLLVYVAKRIHYPLKDIVDYQRVADGKQLIAELEAQLKASSEPAPGKVVAVSFNNRKTPQHVGILTSVGIIHTYTKVGKVVEHRLNDTWLKRIHSIYEWRQ